MPEAEAGSSMGKNLPAHYLRCAHLLQPVVQDNDSEATRGAGASGKGV